ncbi:hypothetical protein PG997_013521 [Apiospora hydei]|uniref:Uncharacterized protein n=1 Tax=Apiospora hydei TaxID=1337664 RepID=A0ABR1V6E5_9PEZI
MELGQAPKVGSLGFGPANTRHYQQHHAFPSLSRSRSRPRSRPRPCSRLRPQNTHNLIQLLLQIPSLLFVPRQSATATAQDRLARPFLAAPPSLAQPPAPSPSQHTLSQHSSNPNATAPPPTRHITKASVCPGQHIRSHIALYLPKPVIDPVPIVPVAFPVLFPPSRPLAYHT